MSGYPVFAVCPRCGQPLAAGSNQCTRCGMVGVATLGPVPGGPEFAFAARVPEPPSVVPTVLITIFFSVFGLIPAAVAAGQAGRNGHDTSRYWKAFLITFLAETLLAVMATVAVIAGGLNILRSVDGQAGTVSTTGQTTAQSEAGFPASATSCDSSVAVNKFASCRFGLNVAKAFDESGRADGSITAYSPVTKKTYTLTCSSLNGLTTCAGGRGAEIYLR